MVRWGRKESSFLGIQAMRLTKAPNLRGEIETGDDGLNGPRFLGLNSDDGRHDKRHSFLRAQGTRQQHSAHLALWQRRQQLSLVEQQATAWTGFL